MRLIASWPPGRRMLRRWYAHLLRVRLALPDDLFWDPVRDIYVQVLRPERGGILCRMASAYAVRRIGLAEAMAGSPQWHVSWADSIHYVPIKEISWRIAR